MGHPVTHVGDACKHKEACLRMDGLIKCFIVPPQRLYHSVVPFRCSKKLIFACVGHASSSSPVENASIPRMMCDWPWKRFKRYVKSMRCMNIK